MIDKQIEQQRKKKDHLNVHLYKKKRQVRVFLISVEIFVSTNYDKAHNKIPNIDLEYLNLPAYETRLHGELDQRLFANQ